MAKPLPNEFLLKRIKDIEASLASTVPGLEGDVTELKAAYSELVLLENDLEKLIARVTKTEKLSASVNANTASISSIQTAQASLEESQASIKTELEASFEGDLGTVIATITEEQTARASADSALASSISALSSQVDDNAASIVTEQTARSDGDAALASSISILSSEVDDNAAAIVTEQTARSDGDNAIAATVTTLTGRVDGNEADIIDEVTARAGADNALSSSITTLSARVDDTESDLTILNNAYVVGGVAVSKWAVTANANGVITGIEVTSESDGTSPVSEVRIQADKFSITNSTDTTAATPFAIEGSNIVMRANVDIGSGDDQFVVDGANATYGDTSGRHIQMEGYAFGSARLNLKAGTTRMVSIDAFDAGFGYFGQINVYGATGDTGLRLVGGDSAEGRILFGTSATCGFDRYDSTTVASLNDFRVDDALYVAGTSQLIGQVKSGQLVLTRGDTVNEGGEMVWIKASTNTEGWFADAYQDSLRIRRSSTNAGSGASVYVTVGTGAAFSTNDGTTGLKLWGSGTDSYINTSNNAHSLHIHGGYSVANGAHIQLYGSSHASFANHAYHDAAIHYFRSQNGATTFGYIGSGGFRMGSGIYLYANGTKVVGSQQSAISSISLSGSTWATDYLDVETSINDILTALRNHGLIAT